MEFMREFAGGIVAKILLGLLVAAFGLWGISGSIFNGDLNNVIVVGNTKVDARQVLFSYENQLNQLSARFQRRLSREEANSLGLQQNVLGQLVSGAVLDESTRKMGLGISDENLAKTIGDDPNFVDSAGNFSRSRLQLVLRQSGISEEEYIANRSNAALREQLFEGTSAALGMPDAFKDALKLFQGQKRSFDFVEIGPEAVSNKPEATDTELSEYYEANKAQYVAPQYRKLRILKLESADIAKPELIDASEVAELYESRKDSLSKLEKRRIQQLVLKDRAEADAVAARIAAGEGFEEVVTSLGKTVEDIDLGLFQKSELPDNAVADAAFALELNGISEVVDGLFGPVIVKVSEIEGGTTVPLADVEDDLRKELALEQATNELFDTHDQIEDERAAGDTLEDVAKKIGLTAFTVDAVDLSGNDKNGTHVSSIPSINDVMKEVFETDVGVEASPVDVSGGGFVWFEVLGIEEERQKSFDEVKEQVRKAWVEAEIAKKVSEISNTIADKVRGGEEFNEVLKASLPTDSLGSAVTSKETPLLARGGAYDGMSSNAIQEGFGIPLNEIAVATGNTSTSRIVVRVKNIENSDLEDLPEDLISQFNNEASQDILSQMVSDLRSREDVQINQTALNTVFEAQSRY